MLKNFNCFGYAAPLFDTSNLSNYKPFHIILTRGPKNICTIIPIYNFHFSCYYHPVDSACRIPL